MTRLRFIVAASVLTVMIGGQLAVSAYATFNKLRDKDRLVHWQTFPFYDYPMYSKAAGPPVQTSVPRLYAEFADGGRTEIDPEMTGLKYFAWRFNILERLVADPIPVEDLDRLDPAEAEEVRVVAQLIETHRREAAANVLHKVMRSRGDDQRPTRFVVERDEYRLEGRQMKRSQTTQVYEIPDELGDSADRVESGSDAVGAADHE